MLQRGHSGDGYDLASTLCMYDLRKGDLFVLSWAWVRRGNIYFSGLAKFDWKVVAHWATKYSNLVVQQ